MNIEKQISGLCKLSAYIKEFLEKNPDNFNEYDEEFSTILRKSQIENSWFTIENQKFGLNQWADLLTENNIKKWLSEYKITKTPKKVGLILAGNIPLVGFHDVISVLLSQHIPIIKLSSKDKTMLYLFVEGKPTGPIALKGIKNGISRIRIVGEGSMLQHKIYNKLYWSQIPGIIYIDVPAERLDENVTIISVLLDKPLELYREKVKAIESNL